MKLLTGFFLEFDVYQATASFFALLFSLNTLGNVPVFMGVKKRLGAIDPVFVTVAAGVIMASFMLGGRFFLDLFQVKDAHFAFIGATVLLLIGLELMLGISLFQLERANSKNVLIVPLAFPIIVGFGTMTNLLTLRLRYAAINVLCGAFLNIVLIYIVLRCLNWIEQRLGDRFVYISKKVTGVFLIYTALGLFYEHFFMAV